MDNPDWTVSLPWNGATVHLGPVVAGAAAVIAILVAAALSIRVAHIFVRGAVRTVFAREALEGTSRDLTAVEMKKRQDTIETLANNVIRFFVIVIAALMILQAGFRLDVGPAIAGLGIAGIAIGLGTQNLVRDYLNGALILVENQYSKGDIIAVAGVSGRVEDFTLRRTTLRDTDGIVHSVPNGQITVASNMTRGWARVNQDIQVVYGTNLELAAEVIDDVGRALAADQKWAPKVLQAPHFERISELGERGITLKIRGTVRASEQWSVGGELLSRLLKAFAEHGIEMPHTA
ncbi:MAG TPA: mechanosensitive ion channel family protein [Candidatus Limnocylindrales bacterium]